MRPIVSIVGARPQFIKVAIVARALERARGVEHLLIHTGQHYDDNMSRAFFDELEIPHPTWNLGIGSGDHGAQTARMLDRLEPLLGELDPAWVVVYGDTNSTLAGALAAAKLHLRVAHVEAGLRSFNRRMPEEVNRVVADHLADRLFAPTPAAVANLEREGIGADRTELVGDVMYDAALHYQGRAEQRTRRILRRLGVGTEAYVLATVHRAENTDDAARLIAILDGLGRVARHRPVLLPLHPRTRAALEREGRFPIADPRIRCIDPVGYLDMLVLERNAWVVATDSGGVQKEAFFAGRPCVALRDETEWVELVDAGANVLAGADPERIERAVLECGERGFTPTAEPYGRGDAGARIAAALGAA